jgi:hypothetical protein
MVVLQTVVLQMVVLQMVVLRTVVLPIAMVSKRFPDTPLCFRQDILR